MESEQRAWQCKNHHRVIMGWANAHIILRASRTNRGNSLRDLRITAVGQWKWEERAIASIIRPMAADTYRRGYGKGKDRAKVAPVILMVEDIYLDNINKTTRVPLTSIHKAKDRGIGR